jgi:hypothetical protein
MVWLWVRLWSMFRIWLSLWLKSGMVVVDVGDLVVSWLVASIAVAVVEYRVEVKTVPAAIV